MRTPMLLATKKAGAISLLLATLTWPLSALAEPRVVGDFEIAPHTLGVLQVEGAPAKAGVSWFVGDDRVSTKKIAGRLVWTAPAGTFKGRALIIQSTADGATQIDELDFKVTVSKDEPKAAKAPGGKKPPEAASTPAPPPAADPVEAAIKAAYAADEALTKAEDAHQLASLYLIAAKELAEDRALATSGQMVTAVTASQEKLLPKERLAAIREIALGELKKLLPTKGTDALADDHRKKAADLFSKLAKIVGDLK
jgi:hypothetical protein